MEVNRSDLTAIYKNLEDDELLDLNESAGLTVEAIEALKEELKSRGLTSTNMVSPEKRNEQEAAKKFSGRSYDIYQIPNGDEAEVIKVGFSWTGFFFWDVWIVSCGLWKAWGVVILQRVIILYPLSLLAGQEPIWPMLFWGFFICQNIFIGSRAHKWQQERAEKKGYPYLGRIEAGTEKKALKKYEEQ